MNPAQSLQAPRPGPFKALAPYWHRGRDSWTELARRWRFALAGFAAGLLGVLGWQSDALSAFWEQTREVQNMQVQLAALKAQTSKAQAQLHADAVRGPSAWLSQLPSPDRQVLIWLHFSRLLAQHGVHLQALRPVPDALPAPLASQAVAVRLHAQFDDWVAVWGSLNAQGPVWSVDRLRITPQGQGLDIEAVLRVWFGGDADLAAWTVTGPLITGDGPLAGGKSAVFWQEPPALAQVPMPRMAHATGQASNGRAGAAGQTTAAKPVASVPDILSADLAQWPLERIRLLGVWRHAQDAQAILSAGPHWVQARVGQRVGPLGHRLDSIHAHEVHLRSIQGQIQVLGLSEVKP